MVDVDVMDEDPLDKHIDKDSKIKELESDVHQKEEIIVELEGEISKKEYEIYDLKKYRIDLKSQIAKMEMDIEGDSFIKRTKKSLWEKVDRLIMDEWDKFEVIQEELHTCKTIKDETNRLETELGNMPKLVEQVKYYLNIRIKSQLEQL